MSQRKLYLAAYDISDDCRLRQALHVLRDFSTGGQKSVFECFLTDLEKQELLERMEQLIKPEEDRFFVLRLSQNAKTRTLGSAEPPAEKSFYYFG